VRACHAAWALDGARRCTGSPAAWSAAWAASYRDPAGLTDLTDFKLHSNPPPLVPELQAILKHLHEGYDPSMLKLPGEQLPKLVLQCLPTAGRAIAGFTLAQAAARIWDNGHVARLVEQLPTAPPDDQSTEISDEEIDVLRRLQKEENVKGDASKKRHAAFTKPGAEPEGVPAMRVRDVQVGLPWAVESFRRHLVYFISDYLYKVY
jgi:hypothetical protein